MSYCHLWRTLLQPENIIPWMSEVKGMHTEEHSLILACHTSTSTSAWNKAALTSDFLAFVTAKQRYNSVLNRVLTFMIFQWCYESTIPHIQLPQAWQNNTGWRNRKEGCRGMQLDWLEIKKRNETCHKAKFHKNGWAGSQTSLPSAQVYFWFHD